MTLARATAAHVSVWSHSRTEVTPHASDDAPRVATSIKISNVIVLFFILLGAAYREGKYKKIIKIS